MNQTVRVGYITLALLMVVVTSTEDAGAQQVRGQRMGAAQMTSIRNFRAVDISDTELQVTVDYTYAGEAGTSEAYIHAIPQERGGAFDPRTVAVEKIPLSLGDNHVSLTITKRPRSRNFTSESIRVCMSAPGRAILCEDFPFTKSWGTAQQADQAARQCLDEVRKTMGREEIKQLDAGDQRKVTEYCKQGDVNRATRYVMLIGAYRRCTRALDAHIENNNLDVAKDVRSRAYSICRRGDLQKAIEVVAGSPTQEPAAPAEIISFVASNSKVKKGDSVTLSWQTANANTVMLGRAGTRDFRNVQASGSQSVSPDKTTTYVLMAGHLTKGPAKMESKTLQIQVSATPPIEKTCSISGRVTGKLQDQGFTVTHVGIFVPGESKPKFRRQLDNRGRYSFKELPGDQEFRVAPFGKSAAGWRYDRRNAMVSCLAGGSFTVNLHVLGVFVD